MVQPSQEPRLARVGDASLFFTRQQEFWTSVGREFSSTTDFTRAYIVRPQVVAVTDGDTVCCIDVREKEGLCKVELLLPRGRDVELLYPCLLKAFQEMLSLHPHPEWHVWADFAAAVDEYGVGDGGASECKKWNDFLGMTWLGENGCSIHGNLGELAAGRVVSDDP